MGSKEIIKEGRKKRNKVETSLFSSSLLFFILRGGRREEGDEGRERT